MSETTKKTNYLTDAWLVILLALLYGLALAGVHAGLSGRIAHNQQAEAFAAVPRLIPGADGDRTEVEIRLYDGREWNVMRAFSAEGELVGWVMPMAGQGYADRIEVLVGMNADLTTLEGIWVLDQKETPGLGDYITADYFRERFEGKSSDLTLTVVKGEAQRPQDIQALTGATVSSESVTRIVNRAMETLKGIVAAAADGPDAM